jgi:hypothetical protein
MAQSTRRALACAILFGTAALAAQTPRDRPATAAATGTASISGRMTITTTAGLAPVRRARIVLEADVFREPLSTDTDTDGRYRFDKLPEGTYRISGEKAGFTPVVRDPRRAFDKPAPFHIPAGQAVTRDFAMQRGAAIEGQLLKDNGDPAINIVVSAVRVGFSELGRTPIAVKQGRTNDLGRFRIHSLPPGDYLVDAAPDPLEAANQIRTPGPRLPALARTYFPGGARLEDGRLVTVAAGQDLSSIDFTMTTMTVSAVGGGVFNSAGEPHKGALARLQRVGGAVGEVRGFSSIEENTFSFQTVPPGDFWLMAVARPGSGAVEFGAMRIRAEGVDQPSLRIVTQPGVAVNGRVEGAESVRGLVVRAIETEYQLPSPPGESVMSWLAPIGADGSFAFTSLFGPRLFRVSDLPGNYALVGVWAGDQNISDTPIDINGAAPPAPLRIVVTSETGTLTGVARDAKGAPLAGARVVVFGDDERMWGPRSRVIKAVESGADGRYEVRGLLPGKYSAAAVSFLENMAWFDAGVLRQLKTGAQAVDLNANGRQTLDLVVR